MTLKLSILMLFFMFYNIGLTYGQTKNEQPSYSIRLKSGMSLATWWGSPSAIDITTKTPRDPYDNRRFLSGFTGGGAFEINLFRYLSIQLEILFTMRGYKTKETVQNNNQTEKIKEIIRLNYVDIPFLLKFTAPSDFGSTHFYVGPVYGKRTGINSFKVRKLNNKQYIEKIAQVDIDLLDKEYKTDDFGLSMGLCFDFNKGSDIFIIDVRYTLGLIVINQLSTSMIQQGMNEQSMFKHKSHTLNLCIGYGLRL